MPASWFPVLAYHAMIISIASSSSSSSSSSFSSHAAFEKLRPTSLSSTGMSSSTRSRRHHRGHRRLRPVSSSSFVPPILKRNGNDNSPLKSRRHLLHSTTAIGGGNVDVDVEPSSLLGPANEPIDAHDGGYDIDTHEQRRVDDGLRFSGVGRLYADDNAPATSSDDVLDRLTSATVAVFGIGGVGSWCAESLCRSGIGNIILVDLDDVCISNTNRQLHATSSNVGKMKIDVTRDRLLDINPNCRVTLLHDFVTEDNAMGILGSFAMTGGGGLTACVDAIDGLREKTALILACVRMGVPVVTCGGAAGRKDPTKVVVDDLTRVSEDRLLFKCRKSLRQDHGFAKVPLKGAGRVRSWRINAVYSTEVMRTRTRAVVGMDPSLLVSSTENGEDGGENANYSSFRVCDGAGVGTASFVTGTYGLVAACKVVEMIALDELVAPKKQGNAR